MTTYNIIEVIRICTEQKYKYIAFYDQTGRELIAFNSNNVTAADRLAEIQKRLESPALKDGIYCVKGKTSPRVKTVADEYFIKKGDYDVKEIQIGSFSPEILSYDKALEMQTKIAKYEMEIEQLKIKIDALEIENKYLQELEMTFDEEEDEEEETPTLAENAKSFLSEFLPILTPLIDKHFDLQQQKLNLEAQKILRSNPYRPKQQAPAAEQEQGQEKEIARILAQIQAWLKAKSDDEETDEETYQQLISLYNTASGIDNFLEMLNNYNSELYEDLRQSIG